MADARFDGQPSSGATPLDNAILIAALRGIAIQSIIFFELCIDINGALDIWRYVLAWRSRPAERCLNR